MVSQCCVAGEIHTGTPTGRISKIHGLDCYIAEPSGPPKGVIVIIPDALGWTFTNNRIIADEYARKGNFLVYLPEFMNGYAMSPTLIESFEVLFLATGFWGQLQKIYHFLSALPGMITFGYGNRAAIVGPRLFDFYRALRANEGADLPIGTAGFCWGGYWTLQLCHDVEKAEDGRSLIDCGYTAHPSNLAVPRDIEKVRVPLSVAAAGNDALLQPPQMNQAREILEGLQKKSGGDVEHEFRVYEGAHHGFATRGSKTDPKESQMGLDAEDQAVNWFSKFARA